MRGPLPDIQTSTLIAGHTEQSFGRMPHPMGTWREDWPARVDRWREVAILSLVLAGAVATPRAFVRDPADLFRLPKAVLFRAEAILLASVVLAAALLGASLPRLKRRDAWVLLQLAAFVI